MAVVRRPWPSGASRVVARKERPTQRKYEEAGTLEAFSKSYETTELSSLDERFFALSLSPLRIRYIRAHPDEFTSQ